MKHVLHAVGRLPYGTKMNVIMLRWVISASVLLLSSSAWGQVVDERALDALDPAESAVPTLREPAGAAELRAAMRRIALQPSDADALADAGSAALTLGDANAALNFFTRANTVRPRNGKIVAGLAAATVRTENPFEALRLFDDAVSLGISERSIATDRALAFDLLGNFARAQQDYQLARSGSVSDDLIIQQAISFSLAGQVANADGMLLPLLQKNNGAAWRARAFMLAARGEANESAKVTQGFMDARSAQKMERYLRLMPSLTAAQQAAAIHLGHFPANNIGRDSENVRRVAATIPIPQPVKNESRLIPTGEPFGKKTVKAKPEREKSTRRRGLEEVVRPAKKPQNADPAATVKVATLDKTGLTTDSARAAVDSARISTIAVAKTAELPPPESARPLVSVMVPNAALPKPVPTTQGLAGAAATTNVPSIAPVSKLEAETPKSVALQKSPQPASSQPATRLRSADNIAAKISVPNSLPVSQTTAVPASVAVTTNSVAVPVAQPVTPPASARTFDLAAIVSSIDIPENEQRPSAVPVDLSKLKALTPKPAALEAVRSTKVDPKTAAKVVAETHPARFWVQIATGEASALGFDYRKWTKKNADLFKGQNGWTSAWGRTDRLVVGPFPDLKSSKKWEADFRKAGGDGFAWKSENGVVVSALKGK